MSAQLDILLRRIETEIRRRSSTDRRMSYAWIIVPILPIIVGIALVIVLVGMVISSIANLQQVAGTVPAFAEIFTLYAFALVAFYAVLFLGAIALYYLIDRRNRHFKRQQQLFAAVPMYLSTRKSLAVYENIAKLSELSEDSMFEEQDRPASLWAILYIFVTPIVGLVVAYNLTQDLRKHEERQSVYQQTLPLALDEAGIARPSIASGKSHKRDPMVYIVLTAITAGLFWIYWFYTLLRDYNEHFADQAMFEDQILASLKPSTKCATCGGSIPQDAKFCPLCGAAQPSGSETADRKNT